MNAIHSNLIPFTLFGSSFNTPIKKKKNIKRGAAYLEQALNVERRQCT